ncbi:unnamed protein product [Calicophoron daubneyi]|uniref:Uncharacterized protein n=1 Tax=Calicophoron daubneyi TaxID=300641 RepID=A0AAV2TP91_CALDB
MGASQTIKFFLLLVTLCSSGVWGILPYFRPYNYDQHSNSAVYSHSQPSIWMSKHHLKTSVAEQPTEDVLFGSELQTQNLPFVQDLETHARNTLNSVDPGTYYADWYGLLNGLGSQRCYPIPSNMSLCQNIGYKKMILPNYLRHEDLHEAVDQSQVWVSLAYTECHPDLRKFLCALYAPVCVDELQERLVEPCRDLCDDVRQSCLPKMLQFGFGWPEMVTCSRFPLSNTKMCVPLTSKIRPRCSGCVEEPSFESLVSSYCMADIVVRARILRATRTNNSAGSVYTLLLDQRPKTYKLIGDARQLSYLNFEVGCGCSVLDKVLDTESTHLGRWMIMGKLSEDRKSIKVEHLSRVKKSNLGLRRALRAMRNPSPALCRLSFSEKQSPLAQTESPDAQVTAHGNRGRRAPVANYGSARSKRRTRIQTFTQDTYRPVKYTHRPHHYRPTSFSHPANLRTNPRRSLVRRSEAYPDKDTRTTTQAVSNQMRVSRLVRVGTTHQKKEKTNKAITYQKQKVPIPSRGGVLEAEKDLFSPQNLVPWLK